MQHVRIAFYDLIDGTFDELVAVVRQPGGMLDTFRASPGFISYGVADSGNNTLISISVWDSHVNAEAAVAVAREWVAAYVADRVQLTANRVGDFAFLEGSVLVPA